MTTLRLVSAPAAQPVPRLRPAFLRLLATLESWSGRASGRRELAALSDMELKDIGLTRMDARMEADKPFWRA